MKPTHLALAAAALISAASCSDPPGGEPPPAAGKPDAQATVDASASATTPDARPTTLPDAAVDASPDVPAGGVADAAADAGADPTVDGGADAAPDAGAPDGAPRALASRSVGYARSSLQNLPALAATIDLRKLTHLIITFANPTATEPLALSSSNADVATMVAAGHAAGIKVLVAIGGSTGTPRVLPHLAPDKLPAYVQTVVDFADTHGFDGVDVDVEDASVSLASYEALVDGLSAALKPKQKLVTAAVARWFDAQISAAALAKMDFISVMAYDACNNAAPVPCQHSTYEGAVRELDHFVKTRGVPAAKVVLGVPFYGYCWGPACPGPAPFYSDIVKRFPGAEAMDFIDMPDVKVSYNGRATIERKAKLGRAHGGVMFWHLAADAPAPQSLLDVIAGAL